mgnify:CR=1 FL=1
MTQVNRGPTGTPPTASLRILEYLAANPGSSTMAVAQYLGMDRSNTQMRLSGLYAKRLVARQPYLWPDSLAQKGWVWYIDEVPS